MIDAEQRILCLAARICRDPADEAHLLALLRGQVGWERLWQLGHLHDVLPLLADSLRPLAGQAPIPAEWLARAQRRLYATLLRNTTLRDELARVVVALRDAGVESIPVKGVVLAETIYGNLALRPAADLDVLVRPGGLAAARAALRAMAYAHRAEPIFAELHHPYHDPQYFRQVDGADICLELHWALWAEHFFHLDTGALWERAIVHRLGGVETRLLSPEDTLLHLAIHRSRSALRLRFLCDIAELLRRHGAALDWGYILGQARAAGARTALYYALALPTELLGAPLPPEILPRLGVGRLKRRLLENTCGAGALFRSSAAGDLRQQPHLIYRILEQDGAGQIAQALGYSLFRSGWKYLHNALRARRSAKT
ncbi:MAG: nucleotidyltransferase family protein [Roseiflexaceae bacterium]